MTVFVHFVYWNFLVAKFFERNVKYDLAVVDESTKKDEPTIRFHIPAFCDNKSTLLLEKKKHADPLWPAYSITRKLKHRAL